ncbi:MAG: hypothetical protein JNG86_18780 [Verrucomicrobiaceae bacterium]|nr:hypothetical protein [Verrucomicrobiaceae bacterium]
MEDPVVMPPSPDNGQAWLFWIISTIVLPAIAGAMCFTQSGDLVVPIGLGILAVAVHLGSGAVMKGLSAGEVVFVYLGGWVLMAGSFFCGCMAVVSSAL